MKIILLPTPREHVAFAGRRAKDLVVHDLSMGGTLETAAACAYLQGVRDAVEAIEHAGWPPLEQDDLREAWQS